jgi:prevent-host-death family protein
LLLTGLKAELSAFLSEVKAGRAFIVTDRGTPLAILSAPDWKAEDDEVM